MKDENKKTTYEEIMPDIVLPDTSIFEDDGDETPKENSGLNTLLSDFIDGEAEDSTACDDTLDITELMKNAKKKALEDLIKISDDDSLNGCIRAAMLHLKGDDYIEAINVCKSGLDKYTNSPDLLSILIRAYAEIGDADNAKNTYHVLQRIPYNKYSFAVFSNLNDYLLMDAHSNESDIKQNIRRCKRTLPDEERAYILESELWGKLKKHSRERKSLLKGIKKHKNALTCALNLQKLQLEDTDFKKALKTGYYISICKTNLGVPGDQIRLDISELQNCFCLKGLIFQKRHRNKQVSREEIEKVLTRFEKVKTEYPDVHHVFSDEIEAQEKALKLLLEDI